MVSKRTPLVFSPTSNFHFGIHYFFKNMTDPVDVRWEVATANHNCWHACQMWAANLQSWPMKAAVLEDQCAAQLSSR